ncbi:MAG: hypothetical protein ABJN62_19515 [Halioglobus sp.]
MKFSTQRNILRTFHLAGAAIIGTYIYSPWSNLEWFTLLNQVIVVPLLSLSGIWMWKGQSIKAALKH